MTLTWETIVFAMIGFAILYWLLNKFAFGPLFGIMEKRRELVLGEMKEAEENRKQSEQFIQEQREELEKARKEAYEILENARAMSARQADEILEKARSEANRVKDEALKEIEQERKQAVAELRNQVSAMSVMIASKIIEKQIDEASEKQLIERYLNEVGDAS